MSVVSMSNLLKARKLVIALCWDERCKTEMSRAFRDGEFLIVFPKTPEEAWAQACSHNVTAIILSHEFSLHSTVFSKYYPTLTWDKKINPRELARQLTHLCRFCGDKAIN